MHRVRVSRNFSKAEVGRLAYIQVYISCKKFISKQAKNAYILYLKTTYEVKY